MRACGRVRAMTHSRTAAQATIPATCLSSVARSVTPLAVSMILTTGCSETVSAAARAVKASHRARFQGSWRAEGKRHSETIHNTPTTSDFTSAPSAPHGVLQHLAEPADQVTGRTGSPGGAGGAL